MQIQVKEKHKVKIEDLICKDELLRKLGVLWQKKSSSLERKSYELFSALSEGLGEKIIPFLQTYKKSRDLFVFVQGNVLGVEPQVELLFCQS